MRKSRFFLFIFLLMPGCVVMAQEAHRNTPAALKAYNTYGDSLAFYKAQLDSVMHLKDSLQKSSANDLRTYRLFSPLAYYPDVMGKKLMGEDNTETDNRDGAYANEVETVLRKMYLEHPELVMTTVSRLHASASRAEEVDKKPVRRKVEVVKEEIKEVEAAVDAPVELFVYKPNFWTFKGDYSLQFMQSHLSENWYQSGESNLSMLGNVVLQLNYDNKGKVKIENKLEMKLGFQTSESDTVHTFKTNSDLLRYTGKLGVQATKNWYYAFQTIATTQFAYGYKTNDEHIYSDFLSPLTLNLSLGMDYNIKWLGGKLNGNAHLAPIAYNWKHVGRKNLATRNGIPEWHHSMDDYGSQVTINLVWTPTSTFKWGTRLYGYTTYHRSEIQWENTLAFQLSKYINTTLFLYPRLDDSAKRGDSDTYWQFKEYFSLGFSYSM